jgi:hypothetical protein
VPTNTHSTQQEHHRGDEKNRDTEKVSRGEIPKRFIFSLHTPATTPNEHREKEYTRE